MIQNVNHYPKNTNGRTFVVGDLHGCIDDLMAALSIIGFDKTTDIVYATGDLGDRGAKSKETIELIYEPWFRSVMGNHDQMIVEGMLSGNSAMMTCWLGNGGGWRYDHEDWVLKDLAKDIQSMMPYIIVVGEGEDRFNIVHADLHMCRIVDMHPSRQMVTDEDIDVWNFGSDDIDRMLWGWGLVKEIHPKPFGFEYVRYHHPTKLSTTYVGHSTLAGPMQVEKQIYLDGGAVYGDNMFIAEPYAQVIHKYSRATLRVSEIMYSSIPKYRQ